MFELPDSSETARKGFIIAVAVAWIAVQVQCYLWAEVKIKQNGDDSICGDSRNTGSFVLAEG